MVRSLRKFGFTLSLCLLAATPVLAQQMSQGRPAHLDILGMQTFLPVELHQLAQADLWYVRYDSLRKRGIKIPPQGIADPEFKKWYLEQNAYQTPSQYDQPHHFTGKTKTAYSSYYGGLGNASNHGVTVAPGQLIPGVQGDGRATVNGLEQHKGNLTPMVPQVGRDPNHNGALQIIDGMEEAIWSEIFANEFKYGANETFGLINAGTYSQYSNGQVFPRGLQGRDFAVRIAHFMLGHHRDPKEDMGRIKSILPNLTKALPYPNNKKPVNEGEALRAGLLEFTRREALTQAEYYAKRFYFGSDSPSNVGIKGERLDLTAHSAFLGYSKIYRKISDGKIPFGTIDEVLLTFTELQESLEKSLDPQYLPYLPSKQEFVEFFTRTYNQELKTEMTRLIGAPNEIIDSLVQSPVLSAVGSTLLKISRAGNENEIMLDFDGIQYSDRYKLNRMLADLGSQKFVSAAAVDTRLSTWIPDDAALRREFAENYYAFRKEVEAKARSRGISAAAVSTYIQEASKIRNQDRPELVLSHERVRRFWQAADSAIASKNGKVVEDFIQGIVDRNTFNFKEVAPYQVVVKQTRRPAEGIMLREVFDAKSGQYGSVLRINVASGEGYFNGRTFTKEQLETYRLDLGDQSIQGKRNGQYLDFYLAGIRNLNISQVRVQRGEGIIRPDVSENANSAIGTSCELLLTN